MTTEASLPQPRTHLPFDAVAFDMDGLLVDTEPLWWRAEADIANAMGGQWTEADSRECVGGPMEKVAAIIIASAGGGDPTQIISDVIKRVIELLATEPVRWLPGARELLAHLQQHGVPHALVSASPRPIVNAVLGALGDSASSLQFSISADDVLQTKPAPDPYLEAARRFGCPPDRLLVFEDSPTGTTSAVTSGAFVVAVPHVGGVQERPRLRIMSSLLGLEVDALAASVQQMGGAVPAKS